MRTGDSGGTGSSRLVCVPVNQEVGGSNPLVPVLPNDPPRNHLGARLVLIRRVRGVVSGAVSPPLSVPPPPPMGVVAEPTVAQFPRLVEHAAQSVVVRLLVARHQCLRAHPPAGSGEVR
jgi:hypothetical protein